ncbi:MAG: hypothetical protein V1775_16360 [Bacteroidota bacterium]
MKAITENSKTIVFFDGEKLIARLVYQKRLSSNASIRFPDGTVYEIVSLDFWKSVFEIQYEGKPVIAFRKKWTGKTAIETLQQAGRSLYTFRQRGFFDTRYVLSDKDDRELAVVRSKFRWKGLTYDFHIQISDSLKRRDDHLLLVILMTYLARLFIRQRHSSAAVS